jgi:glutamate/tyrosine decarboxylase-like PLP-dependent enzyme
MAAAWAVMNYLGDEGYLRLTESARSTTRQLAQAIQGIDGLHLRATPDSTLLSFGAQLGSDGVTPLFDVFAVADALAGKGWYVDKQSPPNSLHCTVNAVHHQVIDEFIIDLRATVHKVREVGTSGTQGSYGTIE